MSSRSRSVLAGLAGALMLGCGTEPPLTGPSLAKGPPPSSFSAAPNAVEFGYPPGGSAVVTVSAQYLTTVTSATSNADCATVSPTSVPTRKPKGSSVYIATFTITATGVGTCVVTLTEKNGKTAPVQVTVVPVEPDRIVYASTEFGAADIFIMDLNGDNKTRLTSTTDIWDFNPVLSADGRKLVYVESNEASTIHYSWMISPDGSGKTALPETNGLSSLSPDRSRVAYASRVDGKTRIFTADLSGANAVQLTSCITDFTYESMPFWTGPHPGKIVFLRESPRGVWIMNPDGTDQTRLTAESDPWLHGPPSGASLSPDGQWVVFDCQPTTHVYDICIIKVDGTGQAALTTAAGDDRSPRWTRDGRIVFTSRRDGNEEVYIMNADGTGQVNLTNSPANESTGHPRPTP